MPSAEADEAIASEIKLPEVGVDIILPEDYFERREELPIEEAGFYALVVEELGLDYPDVSETTAHGLETLDGDHYAWVRVPRFIHQRRDTYKATKGAFTALDIGSSVPFYSELLDSLHLARCEHKAAELVKAYCSEGILELTAGETAYIDPSVVGLLTQRLGKNSPVRAAMSSHVRKVLYGLKESDLGRDDEETTYRLFHMLSYEMFYSKDFYVTHRDTRHYEGRNNIDCEHRTALLTTFEDIAAIEISTAAARAKGREIQNNKHLLDDPQVKAILAAKEPAGEAIAKVIASHSAFWLGRQILQTGLARPFHTISADLASADQLIEAAQLSFDRATRLTGVYKRALARIKSGEKHLQANVLSDDLEVIPDSSISLITMFDCFPIGFKIPETATANELELYRAITLSAGERWYRKLVTNGRMVIFTWDVADGTAADQQLLDDMLRQWDKLGADISIKVYSRDRLHSWMTPAEKRYLAGRSPLFATDFDLFRVLVVQKPRERNIPPNENDNY